MNRKLLILGFSCIATMLLMLVLQYLNVKQEPTGIIISEICSRNERVIYNKTGKYIDYVELYNPLDYALDISGYKIADNKLFENAYIIEECVIESGQYKVIFPENFGISDHEMIYLLDNSSNVLDQIKIPTLAEDSSYAKNILSGKWSIMISTPEQENVVKMTENKVSEEIAAPIFSADSGFYEEPFYLEISVPEGMNVYYTVDGSEPSVESILYQEPIYIEDITYKDNVYASREDFSTKEYYIPYYPVAKSNVIRAVAIDAEGRMSKETVGDFYVEFEGKQGLEDICIVSIITNPENLFGFENGIYVKGKVWAANWDEVRAETDVAYRQNARANYRMEGKGWRREAFLRVYGNDRQLRYEQQIEIGIHGGWSVAHNQKGFNLYALPEKDGQEYLCKGLFADTETTLMLRAGGFRDTFATKIREVLNHQLVEDRSIGILRAIPCQVFLNGEYWGLYCFQERIDGSYIESHYGVAEENVVILKNKEVVEGEDSDYQLYASVLDFVKNNDLSISENYEKIKEYIDIQSYVDYYCFQIYVANCDSITNNYALWRSKTVEDDKYCDGRWRWILYDTDDSAGMIDADGLTAPETNTFVEGYWDIAPMEDLLFSSLFKNEEFRSQFAQNFVEIVKINFDPDRVNGMIDELSDEYAKGTILSHQRYVDGNYTEDQYFQEIEILRDFFNRRQEYALQYMYDILEQ